MVSLTNNRIETLVDYGECGQAAHDRPPQQLRLGFDDGDGHAQVVRRDRKHLVLERLDLALSGHVADQEDAARERTIRIVERGAREAEDASTWTGQLDLSLVRLLATLQRFDKGRERLRDLLSIWRPFSPVLSVEQLPQNNSRMVEAQQRTCGVVESNKASLGIDNQQCVCHAGQNRFE